MFPRLIPKTIRRLTTTSRLLQLQRPGLLAPLVTHIHGPQQAKLHTTMEHQQNFGRGAGALSDVLEEGASAAAAMGLTFLRLFHDDSSVNANAPSPVQKKNEKSSLAEKNEKNVIGDHPFPDFDWTTRHRNAVSQFKLKLTPPPAGQVATSKRMICIKDKSGADVQMRVYEFQLTDKWARSEETIYYIPGTAYVASESNVSEVIGARMAWLTGAKVIIPYAHLAPECSYEIIFHQIYEALKFYINIENVNPAKLILSGYSSGGGFAANVAIRAREEGLPILAGFYQSGLFDLTRFAQTHVSLYRKVQNQDKVVPEEFIQTVIRAVVPGGDVADPAKSALLQNKEKLRALKLPTSVFVVGTKDRTFGDTILFASMLEGIGVKTILVLVDNGTHAYWWQRDDVLDIMFRVLKQAVSNEQVISKKKRHVFLYGEDRTLKEIQTEELAAIKEIQTKEMKHESSDAAPSSSPSLKF